MGPPQPELRQQYSPRRFTPLTVVVSQVLRMVQHKQFLRWPSQMRSDPTKRDNTKYCEFHRDHEHRTGDCIQLRKEIEYLIRRGYLRRFVASEGQDQAQQPPPPRHTTTQHQQPLGEIHVISGGFAGCGESSSTMKAHLRSIRSGEVTKVQAVSKLPRLDTAITFSDLDLEGCQHPHDDPLVIRAVVANKTIHRVLVDNESSADIIFALAFYKMGIGREKLELVSTHLRGFSGEKVLPWGSIQLVLTFGDPPCQATTAVRFLIVDAPFVYNMLLGRPSLNAIKVIPSAYHMMIKFPTTSGVGMGRGDQRVARECYSASMKQKAIDNIYLDEFDMRDKVNTRPKPSEELEPVPLDDNLEHLAYIGSKLAEDLINLLTHFLKQNKDVFAWKQANMGEIDPAIITHRLNASPSFKPVKQKEGALLRKVKKQSTRRSASCSRQGQSERWSTLNVWPTSYSSKKRMTSGDSTSTSLTSTEHAQKIVSLCLESTSYWMPPSAMNSSVSWMLSPATTRSAWIPTTKKRPSLSRGKGPITTE